MKDTDRRSAIALGLAAAAAPVLMWPQSLSAQTSDVEAVRAANAALYAAFSARDIRAMEAVWAPDANVTVIHPASRAPVVGWDAVRRSYEEQFSSRFTEVAISMGDPRSTVRQGAAWVVGTETVRGRRPNGDAVNLTTLATKVLEKREGRWLMAHHHASGMPPP
jgi:uncharacterized protein (TIGR02246 family)